MRDWPIKTDEPCELCDGEASFLMVDPSRKRKLQTRIVVCEKCRLNLLVSSVDGDYGNCETSEHG